MDTATILIGIPIMVTVVAIAAIIVSMWSVDLEREGLEDRGRIKWRRLLERNGEKNAQFMERIREKIKNEKLELREDGGYAWERADIICKAVDSNLTVRIAPSLNDLRELTLQQEQSRISTCVFRTLLPTILVLGIGCTLFGVHGVLANGGKEMIEHLGKALLPGATAVLCTITLFVIRGLYNRQLSRLIIELDQFTLNDLLPCFQEPEPVFSSLKQYTNALKRGLHSEQEMGSFKAIVSQLNTALNIWNKSSDSCEELLSCVAEIYREIGEKAADLQEKSRDNVGYAWNALSCLLEQCQERAQNADDLIYGRLQLFYGLKNVLEALYGCLEQRSKDAVRISSDEEKMKQTLEQKKKLILGQKKMEVDAQRSMKLAQWLYELAESDWQQEDKIVFLSGQLHNRLSQHSGDIRALVLAFSDGEQGMYRTGWEALKEEYFQFEKYQVALFQWAGKILDYYQEILEKQNEECINLLSTPLYPSGMKGFYMSCIDRLYRYGKKFHVLLIFVLGTWQ